MANDSSESVTRTIACKLTSGELRERKATVIAALKQMVLERTELSSGYSYQFAGDETTLDHVMEFIKTERACCGFFTFTLTVSEDHAMLALTGPDGAKAFIDSEIGL